MSLLGPELEVVAARQRERVVRIADRLGARLELALIRMKPREVPGLDWVRAYRVYQMAVEQDFKRQPPELGGPEQPLTPEEEQEAIDGLVKRRLDEYSDQQLGAIMLERVNARRGGQT